MSSDQNYLNIKKEAEIFLNISLILEKIKNEKNYDIIEKEFNKIILNEFNFAYKGLLNRIKII